MRIKQNLSSKLIEKGIADIRKRARKGDMEAQYDLGVAYARGEGVKRNWRLAKAWFKASALQGHPIGMWKCSCTPEAEDRFPWILKAAEAGFVFAQWEVGTMYQYGEGVAQDFQKAIPWFQKAAEQDDSIAYAASKALGYAFERGEGVEQSWEQAVFWFKRSNDQLNALYHKSVSHIIEFEQKINTLSKFSPHYFI